jgi:membrane associated rhomboid family serine protease
MVLGTHLAKRRSGGYTMNPKPGQAMIEHAGRVKMSCPTCGTDLASAGTKMGIIHACPQCQGRAVGVAVLRRILGTRMVHNLWSRAKVIKKGRGKRCPACSRAMCDVVAKSKYFDVHLDVCTRCQLVWFDAEEFDAFPREQEQPQRELSLEAREAIAQADLELDKKHHETEPLGNDAPDELWKWIPAFFGLLIEEKNPSISSRPWITWGLTASLILIFSLTWSNLQQIVADYGLIPTDCWRLGGLTFLTSFCLHADIVNLLINLYFLFVFGDNVEDDLGHWRFAWLVLLAALMGDFMQIALDPQSNVSCVGSNGGISGIIAYYALRFPRARLGMLWPGPFIFISLRALFTFFLGWSYFPAAIVLFGWIGLQIAMSILPTAGHSHVAGIAHLGGAAVGVAAWVLWKFRDREQETEGEIVQS